MADLKFDETHNLVAFLEKPNESDGFEQIVDFLNGHTIKYALTVNPTIYTSCIEQFWATAKVKTVNEEKQLQALVDKKKVIITESTIRRNLHLEDAEGGVKFLMYPRFVQLFVNQQLGDMSHHKKIFVTPSHTKKVFGNMKREGKGFSRRKKQLRRKQRKDTEAPQSSGPTEPIAKEAANVESVPNIPIIHSYSVSSLIDETQGRNYDNLMFDTGVLDEQEVEVEKIVSTAEVTTDSATTTNVDELTLAQTLIEIKAAKPKVRGVMIQEPSEFTTTTTTTTPAASKPSQDKGKEKMIESKKPLKKKNQIMYDQEVALNLQAQMQAELEEQERLAIEREDDEELTIKEKSILFVELIDKRKKHFAKLRVEEQRRKPLTKAQKRNQMYSFVPMDSEVVKDKVEGSEKRAEDSTKRAGEKLEQEIIQDDEVAIDAIPLATKPAPIVNFQIHRKGRQGYYEIMRADRSANTYLLFSQLLKEFNREDLDNLWKLVKAKHGNTRPEEGYERVLWGDLKTMFEHHVEDLI
ncbi:hypothetical protein Tco_0195387 [Tanacetum coccineum]